MKKRLLVLPEMEEEAARDLWWQARLKTARMRPSLFVQLQGKVQSLRGAPVQPVYSMSPLVREGAAIVVDLNKYRADFSLKNMVDFGVNRFILRIGGPTAWIADRWGWEEDKTFRPYMDQLAALGLTNKTLGYIVHCSGAAREAPSTNTDHVQLLDQWTSGGYMPAAFIFDDEVYEWWSGGVQVKNTPVNHVLSLSTSTRQTWEKFRRIPGIYTARWFIDKYPGLFAEYSVFLDRMNGTSEGTQRPMWYAWVPTVFNETFSNASAFVSKLVTPTSDQIGRFLQCGSYSAYNIWQASFTFRLPNMAVGVDCSVSRGTLADYDYAFNMQGEVTPPPPPPPDNPPPTSDPTLAAILTAVQAVKADTAAARADAAAVRAHFS